MELSQLGSLGMQWLHAGQGKSEEHQEQTKMITQEPSKHLFLDATGPFP